MKTLGLILLGFLAVRVSVWLGTRITGEPYSSHALIWFCIGVAAGGLNGLVWRA